MCTIGEPPSVLYVREDDISSSSLSNNLSNERRRVNTRKGATRKNLSIFLKTDGVAVSFGFRGERASKLEGRLMGTSARRRTIADGAACYDDCITARPSSA